MKKYNFDWENIKSFFILNKIFVLSLILFLFSCIISIILIIFLSNEKTNMLMTIVTSLFTIFFTHQLGNLNILKKKKINKIKLYIKDIKILKEKVENFIKILRKEFIYKYEFMCDYVEFVINNFEHNELDLVFIEQWKKSKNFYKNLNNIIFYYKKNYQEFNISINNLKRLGFNNDLINKFIDLLVKVNINLNWEEFKLFLKKEKYKFSEEIINLNEFIKLFTNNEFEILKLNLDETLKDINSFFDNFIKITMYCNTKHNHNKNKNDYGWCWITLKKCEQMINEN